MKRAIVIVSLTLVVSVTALLAGDAVAPAAPLGSASVSFRKVVTANGPLLFPSSLAAGDLTHSGIPDLAVISPNNTTPLEYALGIGNGRFRAWRQNDNVGYAPSFVLLADVDGDGNLDAITTDDGDGDLNLAFGDGKGHLYGGRRLLVDGAGSTYIVAVADLNGDGIPDIVGTTNNGIFVIMGKGSRKFAKAANFSSGGRHPYGVAVGDLNHDGIPDLVVANNGADEPPYDYNIAVLLGNGDGTFSKPVRYHAGVRPWQLALGDFNGDGNLDAAVVPIDGKSRIVVLLGKGDGTFSSAKAYPSGVGPESVVAADFNGDGKLDLAVTNNANPKPCHVSILLGNGDGTFQPPVKFRVGFGPTGLITADFNNDGKPDLATLTGYSGITVLLNTTPFPAPPHPH
jgi:hypothetical protein